MKSNTKPCNLTANNRIGHTKRKMSFTIKFKIFLTVNTENFKFSLVVTKGPGRTDNFTKNHKIAQSKRNSHPRAKDRLLKREIAFPMTNLSLEAKNVTCTFEIRHKYLKLLPESKMACSN